MCNLDAEDPDLMVVKYALLVSESSLTSIPQLVALYGQGMVPTKVVEKV